MNVPGRLSMEVKADIAERFSLGTRLTDWPGGSPVTQIPSCVHIVTSLLQYHMCISQGSGLNEAGCPDHSV